MPLTHSTFTVTENFTGSLFLIGLHTKVLNGVQHEAVFWAGLASYRGGSIAQES